MRSHVPASGKRKSTSSTDSTGLKTTERSTLIAESAKSVRRTTVTTVKVMRNNALRTARVLLKNQRSKRFKEERAQRLRDLNTQASQTILPTIVEEEPKEEIVSRTQVLAGGRRSTTSKPPSTPVHTERAAQIHASSRTGTRSFTDRAAFKARQEAIAAAKLAEATAAKAKLPTTPEVADENEDDT